MKPIVVPGGFGDRGVDGMIVAARYAREQGVPFLAMGFGMQLVVVKRCEACWASTTRIRPRRTR